MATTVMASRLEPQSGAGSRSRRLRLLLAAGWLAIACIAGAGRTAADETAPAFTPYKARYQVSYRGISGGQIEASFRRGGTNGLWIYETRAFPNLLGRLAVSTAARERSTMLIDATGVRPLTFSFDDGTDDTVKDIHHSFDWTSNRVVGVAKDKPFDLAVQPGTQDTSSVQAAMIVARLAGQVPKGFTILSGDDLHEYRYWSEGRQTVVTPYGQFEAEVWASQRPGSNRVSKIWHVPALGYIPVQAIQYRKGNAEVQMRLVTLERGN